MKFLLSFIILLYVCFPIVSQTSYADRIKGEWVLHSVVTENMYMDKVVTQIHKDDAEIVLTIDNAHFMVNGDNRNRFFWRIDDTVKYRLDTARKRFKYIDLEGRYGSKKKRWKVAETFSIEKLNENELAFKKLFRENQDFFESRSSMTYYFRKVVKDSSLISPFLFEGDWHICGETPENFWKQDTILLNRDFCDYKRITEPKMVDSTKEDFSDKLSNKTDTEHLFPVSVGVYEKYVFTEMLCFKIPVNKNNYWYTKSRNSEYDIKSGEEWYLENSQILVVKDFDNTCRYSFSFNRKSLLLIKVEE